MPRRRPIDPQTLRHKLLKHVDDYIRAVPVADRSAHALRALVEIVNEVGPVYEREEAVRSRRVALVAGELPFPVQAEGEAERVDGERNVGLPKPTTAADVLNAGLKLPFEEDPTQSRARQRRILAD